MLSLVETQPFSHSAAKIGLKITLTRWVYSTEMNISRGMPQAVWGRNFIFHHKLQNSCWRCKLTKEININLRSFEKFFLENKFTANQIWISQMWENICLNFIVANFSQHQVKVNRQNTNFSQGKYSKCIIIIIVNLNNKFLTWRVQSSV